MPWHDVQYVKITCRAGPFGGVTCGRVGRPPIWPAGVATDAHSVSAATPTPARTRPCRSIARPDLVRVDPVQVQDAQQHVRGALRVVGEHEVTVSLERAVDAADENHRYLLVRMPVRVAH